MKASIVTTTIHQPVLLADYCRNLKRYGHEAVEFIVVGDKKTPVDVGAYCRQLQEEHGYVVEYYDVDRQEEYLKPFAELAAHLPYDSIQRRNVGLLLAFERGADVIVTIDDDNFVSEEDFLGHHAVVGSVVERTAVHSSTGWFNVCRLLIERQRLPFYHRGYPMGQRWAESEEGSRRVTTARVVVNAGLWLEDPDIDAVTRMALPIHAIAVEAEGRPGIVLDDGTWCPFNSQNTALAREVIPAYFLSPHIGRYDDVWASFFLRVICDHLGGAVGYGSPVVRQVRNAHDLWRDLDAERLGMHMTDRLVNVLRTVTFREDTYAGCYRELIEALKDMAHQRAPFTSQERTIVLQVLEGMEIWSKTFERWTSVGAHCRQSNVERGRS